ncbi:MAG: DNA-binding protein [Duncaniella sp.]
MKSKKDASDRDILNKILSLIESEGKNVVNSIHSHKVYDNKGLMELLNIKYKYLMMLRDKGYIGYSRCGDKYWYSQADVDLFLSRFHYDAFSTSSELPPM